VADAAAVAAALPNKRMRRGQKRGFYPRWSIAPQCEEAAHINLPLAVWQWLLSRKRPGVMFANLQNGG
jgi:hypothetical protein